MNYSGTAYSEEWAREAAVHGHGTWSMVFTSHQEPGSLISGRGWRCPTVVCSWSPVTLGPAFELVTLRGGFQTSTGESVTGMVMVSLELEHAHGARRGNIRAYRGMQSTLAGGSHVAWRTLRMWTGFISASKTASEGALGLVHHGGRCRGQVDWAAAGSVQRAAQGASYARGNLHAARL